MAGGERLLLCQRHQLGKVPPAGDVGAPVVAAGIGDPLRQRLQTGRITCPEHQLCATLGEQNRGCPPIPLLAQVIATTLPSIPVTGRLLSPSLPDILQALRCFETSYPPWPRVEIRCHARCQ